MNEITIITDDFIINNGMCGYKLVPRGSIIQIYNVIKYLNYKYGITFRVFQIASTDYECLFENIYIRALGVKNFDEFKYRIKYYLKDAIVHFNNIDLFIPPYNASHITATIHTNAFLEKESARNWLKKYISDFDKIIVVNEAYLENFLFDNMMIINNGIDISLFRYKRKVYEKPPILLFPNIPEPKKNLHFAVTLIQRLNDMCKERFLLYVSGCNTFNLIDNNIFFMGNVNYGVDMHKVYQQAFITLIPSTSESCSLCMLESMASGTIVLANDIIGLGDYLVDRKTGFLLSVNNVDSWITEIFKLMDDIDLYHNIADNARNHIEKNYSIQLMAEKYYQVWRDWIY